jgi:hypothetical protein
MLGNIVAGTFSAGAPPIAPSSYESIATVTVGSGGTSSIDFTSIGSTYKHLQLRYSAMFTDGGAEFQISFNADTTDGNYARHFLGGFTSSVSAGASTGSNTRSVLFTRNSSSDTPAVSVLDILDYGSTSKNKTVRLLNGQQYNTTGVIALQSLLWMNNSNAITSIKLQPTGGSIRQHSVFALYGIKD